MSTDLQCPVDFVTINENQARLTALQVLLLVAIGLFFGYTVIIAFLVIDFFLRSFNWGKYSILNIASGFLIRKFAINNKQVDRGPKRFAALVGFFFTLSILILSLADITLPAQIIAGVLLIFASLEAFVGFCAGCYVYTFFIRLKER
jgi:uncharacterized membrane protein YidH (DUF202 family)